MLFPLTETELLGKWGEIYPDWIVSRFTISLWAANKRMRNFLFVGRGKRSHIKKI